MVEDAVKPLTITVGDQTIRLRVPAAEVERYQRIAHDADAAVREILAGSGVVGGPRALAMALFQTAVEVDDARAALREIQKNRERLGGLIERIDEATGGEAKKL